MPNAPIIASVGLAALARSVWIRLVQLQLQINLLHFRFSPLNHMSRSKKVSLTDTSYGLLSNLNCRYIARTQPS
ncbi:hypothetical protein F5Y03DRAFT_203739 [Xylaria venustula]|nr:hypothetical protein F5Y03DRAFT_203739 [Xylaria venustula]